MIKPGLRRKRLAMRVSRHLRMKLDCPADGSDRVYIRGGFVVRWRA
jgi:hypothetical protein